MPAKRRKKRRKKSNSEILLITIAALAIAAFGIFIINRWINKLSDFDETPPRIFFNSFNIPLPPNYEIHGIDVSKHQGAINWELAKDMTDGGIKLGFVIMKATEGENLFDKQFSRNWRKTKEVNMTRGAYHFFNPSKPGSTQADFFISKVNLELGDLPPVLDIETSNGAEISELRQNISVFLKKLEKHYKKTPIIYTSAAFYKNYLGNQFDQYPLWVAHYGNVEEPRIGRDWIFWQHSEKGSVNGIREKVDFNVFNGDSATFQSLLITDLQGADLGGRHLGGQ